jgi:2-polyprenyl-6-methoxyphenol hydroxylase-like FAD-dependent oxidoreductase
MGILPEIRRAHTGTRGMALVDAANRRLATMPADLLGDSGGAIAELEILRGDLVGILHAATRDQVEYHAPDFYFDRVSQVRMDRWSVGRVALVGDAAYSPSPMSGMGTSLALVGAYVLAGELAAAGGEHRTAFTRYQQKLDSYVARGHKQARSARGFLLPRSRTQIRARTQVLRMLPHLPWRGLIAGSIQRAANAITLDDYRSYQA